jgi:type III restriction enzyme
MAAPQTTAPVERLLRAVADRVDAWRGWRLEGADRPWTAPGRYAPAGPGERELSETSRALLRHWFRTGPHELPRGGLFRYWPHQRRAVETFIYLHEVRGLRGTDALYAGLGVPRDWSQVDPWPKLGGQLCTGAGKTKVMSLLMAWSVLNALREGPAHLGLGAQVLLISPNLFVKDRLLFDFRPPPGQAGVFGADPVLPPELQGDWRLPVYDAESCPRRLEPHEPALIVTNIHQLYAIAEEPPPAPADGAAQLLLYAPAPAKLEADKTPLPERLRRGPGLLVLNDEAHHCGDEPAHRAHEELARRKAAGAAGDGGREEMAWIRTLRRLHERVGVGLQVDLSATLYEEPASRSPKATRKTPRDAPPPPAPYLHTVVDYTLREAIGDGVVKQPVLEEATVRRGPDGDLDLIGGDGAPGEPLPLVDEDATNAWDKHKALIIAGIFRWKRLWDAAVASTPPGQRPRKPLLFLLCDSTDAAEEVASFLTYGEVFRRSSGAEVLGRQVKGFHHPQLGEAPLFVHPGPDGQPRSEVIQVHLNEKEATNEEAWARTRAIVNAIDHDEVQVVGPDGQLRVEPNPYTVIVSVLMLREGWDVRNVKVVVPLRPCHSRTLTEQTLGRGLRRMVPPTMAEDGAVTAGRDPLYVMRHPSLETVLAQIQDIVTLRTSAELNAGAEPVFAKICPIDDADDREARRAVWARVEGIREIPRNWRDRFRLDQVPRFPRLPWRSDFTDREVETELVEGEQRSAGLRFQMSATPSYIDGQRLIDKLYVEPLQQRLHASKVHQLALRGVVKDLLETRTFQLPAGLPISIDAAMAREDGRITMANLARKDVRATVIDALVEPLRRALEGPAHSRELVIREERSDEIPAYTARAEFLIEDLRRSSFEAAAVDNEVERRFAAVLDRCADVLGWVHNHRGGVGWSLPYEWQGEQHRYHPDFIARARLGDDPQVHHLILETKGRMDERDARKAEAAARHAATLTEEMDEPWHYLLIREDERFGADDLSWWEAQRRPTLGALLRRVERIPTDAGLRWRLLSDRALDAALVARADRGRLPGAALLELGRAGVADPDRLLTRAEALVADGRLDRRLRPVGGGEALPPGELARLLREVEAGRPEAAADIEVGYEPKGVLQ